MSSGKQWSPFIQPRGKHGHLPVPVGRNGLSWGSKWYNLIPFLFSVRKRKYQYHLTENFPWSFRKNGIKALMVSCRGQRKPELRPDWSSPHFSAISIHHFHIAQNTPFYPKRLHKHPYSSSISLGATVTGRRCLYQVFPQAPQIS